jgi:hypothetical protein
MSPNHLIPNYVIIICITNPESAIVSFERGGSFLFINASIMAAIYS